MAMHRSGSSLLYDLLRSHPDISIFPVGYAKGWDTTKVQIAHAYPYDADEDDRDGPLPPYFLKDSEIAAPMVFLERADYVMGAISWMSLFEQKRLEVADVRAEAVRRQGVSERLRLLSDFTLTYEEMTGGNEISSVRLNRLCSFLGVGQRLLTTNVRKITNRPPNLAEILRDV